MEATEARVYDAEMIRALEYSHTWAMNRYRNALKDERERPDLYAGKAEEWLRVVGNVERALKEYRAGTVVSEPRS